MQKKSGNYSTEDVKAFAQSSAGQQLLNLLQNADSTALQQAMAQAKSGEFSKIKDTLSPLLSSAEIQKLMQQFGGSQNG